MKIFFTVFGKEIFSFMRSIALVAVILYSFTADIYIAGAGMQIKPRNVVIGYVDNSGGGVSQKILSHFHQPEFVTPKPYLSQKALSNAIFNKEVLVGLIFNSDFEKKYKKNQDTQLDVLIDATAASQSLTTLAYLQNIILDFEKVDIPLKLQSHKLFNQNADNHSFMALTELLSMITLLTVILTAIVFVKEKEDGTWDLMLLMPVNPKIIILAKSASQVLIVTVGVWSFMLLTLLYGFSSAGIGLFVAAVSKDVMQVAQLSIVIMMPLIFLSGAWTPIYAMHPVFQKLSLISPLRYYIEGSESIFYRGTAFVDLLPYFGGVTFLGVLLYWYGFRKIGRLF